jgi:hypothetical protein
LITANTGLQQRKSTPPTLGQAASGIGKTAQTVGGPDRKIVSPAARDMNDMPGRAKWSPREKPAEKSAGRDNQSHKLPDESGAGDAVRLFKRPEAEVNSFNLG